MRPLLLLGLLVAAACNRVTATPIACTTLTETQCYANRTACHYDPLLASCRPDAPTAGSCKELYRDAIGCRASLASNNVLCAVSPWNNQCFQPLAACAAVPLATCAARSDCKIVTSGGGSACVADAAATCVVAATTPAACAAAGCYYDAFAPTSNAPVAPALVGTPKPTCTASLAETVRNYPDCALWSNYPSPSNAACDSHGCSYNAFTGICGAQAAGDVGVTSDIQLASDYTISNVAVDASTLIMSGTVSIPLSQYFRPGSPRYHAFVIGDVSPVAGVPLAPHMCNSVLSVHPAFGAGLPAVSPPYADASDLQSKFTASVAETHTLAFATGNGVADVALRQIVGATKLNRTDASSILKYAAINTAASPSTTVDLSFSVSLQGGVDKCGWVTTVTPTYTQFAAKLSMYIREGDNVVLSSMTQTVVVNTYGVIHVGATTSNAVVYSLDPTVDTAAATSYNGVPYAGCPVGQKKRVTTMRETWYNPNPNTIVGLRGMQDASMVPSGYLQETGMPTNCFGMKIVAVTPPTSCAANKCVTLVTRESRCVPITSDGDALNLCSHQTASSRLLDLGSETAVYPASLDRKQNYFHYPREWAVGTNGLASSQAVGNDASGLVPDEVGLSLESTTLPDITDGLVATLVLDCGFLATPTSNLSTLVVVSSTEVGYQTSTVMRSMQIKNGGSFCVACRMRDEQQRSTYTLAIDTSVGVFSIQPLNAQGNVPVYATNALTWTQNIAPVLTYSPRYMTVGGAVPSHLPATNAQSGVDGFALPAYWIAQQLPSVGYLINFGVSVSLPSSVGASVSTVVSRRLLQVGDDTPLVTDDQSLAFCITNTTTDAHITTIDLGSTHNSAIASVAVGMSLALLAFLLLLFAFCCGGFVCCATRKEEEEEEKKPVMKGSAHLRMATSRV